MTVPSGFTAKVTFIGKTLIFFFVRINRLTMSVCRLVAKCLLLPLVIISFEFTGHLMMKQRAVSWEASLALLLMYHILMKRLLFLPTVTMLSQFGTCKQTLNS